MLGPIHSASPVSNQKLVPVASVDQQMKVYMQRWTFDSPKGQKFDSAPAMKLYEAKAEIVDLAPNMRGVLSDKKLSRTYSDAATYGREMNWLYNTLDKFTMTQKGKPTISPQADGTVKVTSEFDAHLTKGKVTMTMPARAELIWRKQEDGSWKIASEKLNPSLVRYGKDVFDAGVKKLESIPDAAKKLFPGLL